MKYVGLGQSNFLDLFSQPIEQTTLLNYVSGFLFKVFLFYFLPRAPVKIHSLEYLLSSMDCCYGIHEGPVRRGGRSGDWNEPNGLKNDDRKCESDDNSIDAVR